MNPNFRNFALWAIIALLLIALFSMFQQPAERTGSREIPFSQFLKDVDGGRVKEVVITGNKVLGSYGESGATFQTYAPAVDTALTERMEAKNVTVTVRPETDGSSGFLSYAPDAGRLTWRHGLRKVQGQAADRSAWPRDV
jgi:cell division protease FtsH